MGAWLLATVLAFAPSTLADSQSLPDDPTATVLVRAPADLGDILLDYNGALRPDYGLKPLNVSTTLSILDARWRQSRLHLSAFLTLLWKDSRLAFRGSKGSQIQVREDGQSKLWRPDLIFVEAIEEKLLQPGVITISTNGVLEWSRYYRLSLACPLGTPPSSCKSRLLLESLGYSASDLRLSWSPSVSLPGSSDIVEVQTTAPDAKLPRLEAELSVATPFTADVVNYVLRKEAGEL